MSRMSSIGPAASGVSGEPVTDKGCESPGFLLATALWWQYGFSLAIAITTYVALRHPLSSFKVAAEKRAVEIIVLIVVIGILQAVLWRILRGFEVWEDFCFYAPPSHLAAELLQFIPRITVSLIVISIYARLVSFLNRPDLSSAYLPSPQLQQTPSTDPIPPWERMTIPDFSTLEADGAVRGRPKSSGGASVASLVRVFGNRRPVSAGSTWFTGAETELKVEIHAAGVETGLELKVEIQTVEPALTRSRASSQTMVVTELGSLDEFKLKPEQDTDHLSIAETLHTTRDDPEVASFRGMLDYIPTHSTTLYQSPSMDAIPRPSTPDEQVESMASFMNRQMIYYIIWFPLTHLTICGMAIFRFVYCETTGKDGPVMQGLTLVMIMGQGIADIIIFGFVERRTQMAYKNEIAACSPGTDQGPK
ncbi:hypothetical protein BCR39DRAFT_523162 [Naematelia encephala]|uniref:G protein-coupled glucose receptor regulating Gpa2-domain-containing protein n=1 Tax=Naematelia encephala TaxID=71784 RepID=A0A1Y2BDP8_9TREE|nr:hypothetical protein BCR39DRAFT_523162 [Naematelia encephala]